MASFLHELENRKISVLSTEGKILIGTLRAFDQNLNFVLDNCIERIFSTQGVEEIELGAYFLRGENVCVASEINEQIEQSIDYTQIFIEPIKPCRI